ncbi:MAG: sodium:solute symporter family protein [Acidobacteriota bacterium]|nr:sodium:solute symporter family protein [Acidobacteriota bacterium]
MQLNYGDLAVIALYFVGLVIFGLIVRRIGTFSEYAIASKRVPLVLVAASLCATYIGPGYSLGLASQGAGTGFLYLVIFSFFSLQTIVVGIFFASRLHGYDRAKTIGDVIRVHYGKEAKFVTGVISVGLCVGFASVMARAGGAVLSGALGYPLLVGVLLITVVGVLYTTTGGLKAVILTEAVQFALIVISAIFLVSFLLHDPRTDVSQLTIGIQEVPSQLRSMGAIPLIGLALSLFFGEMLIPPYANRALAAESGGASRWGFVGAGMFSVGWFFLMVSVGVLATSVVPSTVSPDGILMAAAQEVLPVGLLGLLVVGFAAIVMSSQESVLNAGAVAFVRDLAPRAISEDDKKAILWSRSITIFMGSAAIVLALIAPTIIDGLLICYAIWAPSVVPALLWALFGLPTSRWSGFLSILSGAVVAGSLQVAGFPSEVSLLWGFAGSLGGCLVGYVLGRVVRK